MTRAKSPAARTGLRTLLATSALLGVVPCALAQQVPQILTVTFETSLPALPLSDWLTAAMALLLAASALLMLRRQRARGGRLMGWMLAAIAGAGLLAGVGQRMIPDARALALQPVINLTVSPATIDVAQFFPATPLTVTVNNTSSRPATITAITLAPGLYSTSTPTTCVVNQTLLPSASCTITLAGLS